LAGVRLNRRTVQPKKGGGLLGGKREKSWARGRLGKSSDRKRGQPNRPLEKPENRAAPSGGNGISKAIKAGGGGGGGIHLRDLILGKGITHSNSERKSIKNSGCRVPKKSSQMLLPGEGRGSYVALKSCSSLSDKKISIERRGLSLTTAEYGTYK